jgi:hypothetical protein
MYDFSRRGWDWTPNFLLLQTALNSPFEIPGHANDNDATVAFGI